MTKDVARQLAALDRMTAGQLAARYAEVFGEPTAGRNKPWLVRRIAWRLQALAEGGLSDRAKAQAAELARDADLRIVPPRTPKSAADAAVLSVSADPRLPVPGTVLTRAYKGAEVRVTVRSDGFEYDGDLYPSLSAAAKAATGSHCNGFAFFKLAGGNR